MKSGRDVFVFLLFALGIYLFTLAELILFVHICKDDLFSPLNWEHIFPLGFTLDYNPVALVSCLPYWIVYFLRGRMTLKRFLFWTVVVNGVLMCIWSYMVSSRFVL